MKYYFTFVCVVLFAVLSNHVVAQNASNTKAIIASVKGGDAARLSGHFYKTIDITLPGSDGSYSKAQAQMIMKDFFAKNKPVSFTINHQGQGGDGSSFCIGTYKTSNTSYRTYFLIKQISGKHYISQLQFEKD